MKVGVLTFDRALNYGAVLQAFALQSCLTNMGLECDVIDYRCEALERMYSPFPMRGMGPKSVLSSVAYLPTRLSRRARFEAFRQRHMRSSPRRYTREDIASSESVYDRFIVGSDQVWNPDITGGDRTYFLDFCTDNAKKMSYAASVGQSGSFETHDQLYLTHLANAHALSVREEDSRDYLSDLLGRDVAWVMDPVFLVSAEEWGALARMPTRGPYIFVYCLHETDLYRYVERLRQLTGLDVVYVPESIKNRFRGIRVPSPAVEELLGYIRGAQYVVTDSFHVLALSIVFRRAFKVQLKRRLTGLNSRITSLLASVDLEDQVLREEDYLGSDVPTVEYGKASIQLAERVGVSLEYLRTSLGLKTVA